MGNQARYRSCPNSPVGWSDHRGTTGRRAEASRPQPRKLFFSLKKTGFRTRGTNVDFTSRAGMRTKRVMICWRNGEWKIVWCVGIEEKFYALLEPRMSRYPDGCTKIHPQGVKAIYPLFLKALSFLFTNEIFSISVCPTISGWYIACFKRCTEKVCRTAWHKYSNSMFTSIDARQGFKMHITGNTSLLS